MTSPSWPQRTHRDRCQTISRVAGHLVDLTSPLICACQNEYRTDPVETITAELFPLCAAMKWIGKRGPKILKNRRLGTSGRPVWLWGVRSSIERVPHGNVLILAAWNYPLLLPGVQAAQSLAAGNRVQLKPAPGCEEATKLLVNAFTLAGVPAYAITMLDSSTQSAIDAIDAGVDLIVLTGGASTGRKVMAKAAETLTPVIMELSGCDAVIVHPDADLDRTADAITFGLQFNSGATCIAPRRVIATPATADALLDKLTSRLTDSPAMCVHPSARDPLVTVVTEAIRDGCTDPLRHFDLERLQSEGKLRPVVLDGARAGSPTANADLFAPVTSIIRVEDISLAIKVVNECPYRLAASVFGPKSNVSPSAESIAGQLDVGTVVINDLIVPTADPRTPFGGRGQSGFGLTRGTEGLLAMTTAKVTSVRTGNLLPHLRPRNPSDQATLVSALAAMHGRGWKKRLAAIRQMAKRG